MNSWLNSPWMECIFSMAFFIMSEPNAVSITLWHRYFLPRGSLDIYVERAYQTFVSWMYTSNGLLSGGMLLSHKIPWICRTTSSCSCVFCSILTSFKQWVFSMVFTNAYAAIPSFYMSTISRVIVGYQPPTSLKVNSWQTFGPFAMHASVTNSRRSPMKYWNAATMVVNMLTHWLRCCHRMCPCWKDRIWCWKDMLMPEFWKYSVTNECLTFGHH